MHLITKQFSYLTSTFILLLRIGVSVKGAFSSFRQLLATEKWPFKNDEMCILFHLK